MNDFHYQLAQVGRLSIDFVASGHIQCCRYPHRNRPKAHGGRVPAIPYVIMPVFGSSAFNLGAIKHSATQFPSVNTVNTFPMFC